VRWTSLDEPTLGRGAILEQIEPAPAVEILEISEADMPTLSLRRGMLRHGQTGTHVPLLIDR